MRILLADDHPVVVDGLRALLGAEDDVEIVGVARDGLEAVRAASDLSPDIVVLDLMMSGLNGIEATRRITEKHRKVKVLCLSMYADGSFVRAALEAGASGYVLKGGESEELLRAIRSVHSGNAYLSPAVAGHVIAAIRTDGSGGPPRPVLTPREREILQLIAEGTSTCAIASRLNLSSKTIGTHRGNIMDKLGISTVAGLTKYAIREGLTTLDD